MPKKGKRAAKITPVEVIKHKDGRVNIPTQELRQFVAEAEAKPATLLYPRDPSLDPQLVWKGKDEQDREDLAVPVVPVYIQEKVHPQALIRTCGTRRGRANRSRNFSCSPTSTASATSTARWTSTTTRGTGRTG